MTPEEIKAFNELCPYEQGIFVQPYGIPVNVKEPVVYTRWSSGGYSGGNCWNDNPAEYYSEQPPKDRYKVLDLILEKLKPNITYLQYKIIEAMWQDNQQSECEYYGNSTEWEISYIPLSQLEEYLNTI